MSSIERCWLIDENSMLVFKAFGSSGGWVKWSMRVRECGSITDKRPREPGESRKRKEVDRRQIQRVTNAHIEPSPCARPLQYFLARPPGTAASRIVEAGVYRVVCRRAMLAAAFGRHCFSHSCKQATKPALGLMHARLDLTSACACSYVIACVRMRYAITTAAEREMPCVT